MGGVWLKNLIHYCDFCCHMTLYHMTSYDTISIVNHIIKQLTSYYNNGSTCGISVLSIITIEKIIIMLLKSLGTA